MNRGILIILDGYGEGEPNKFNAVENAKTPTLHGLKNFSNSLLKAHGNAVGLFDDEMGGSEVGHLTIGAGRVVLSTAKKIKDEIENKEFDKNKVLLQTLNNLQNYNSNLHLVGLMSDKNIHSNINHCLKIIDLAKDKAKNIFVHFIADGRDSGVFESVKYLDMLKKHVKNIKNCQILSVSGRFYAMDRENNMDRTNLAFNAMFGDCDQVITNVDKYLKEQHNLGVEDQYIMPAKVKVKDFNGVNKNDCVLFFNFREDRLRQMVKKCEVLNCKLVTMADVGGTKTKVLYPNEIVKHTLSEYLSKNKLKQVKIGETTKYAHVTYFLNGGREQTFEGEDRIHVPTHKGDLGKVPQMRAKEIGKATINSMKKDYDAIIVNFSNADMIGHTGNYEATVKALQAVDKAVKNIIKQAKKHNYFVMITADHGNAEIMKTEKGEPHTAHTINPVLCVVVDDKIKLKEMGELKNIAPTFVELLGLKQNKHFEGESLII